MFLREVGQVVLIWLLLDLDRVLNFLVELTAAKLANECSDDMLKCYWGPGVPIWGYQNFCVVDIGWEKEAQSRVLKNDQKRRIPRFWRNWDFSGQFWHFVVLKENVKGRLKFFSNKGQVRLSPTTNKNYTWNTKYCVTYRVLPPSLVFFTWNLLR